MKGIIMAVENFIYIFLIYKFFYLPINNSSFNKD